MMENGIGAYAYSQCVVPSDADHYRNKYRDTEKQTDGTVIAIGFVSPVYKTWEEYKFVLLQNSIKIHLKTEWKYRPDYVSYEYYGTTNWWQLVMWINNCNCLECFDMDEIVVPSIDSVYKVQNEATSNNSYIDLNEDYKQKEVKACLYINPINNINDVEIDANTTISELQEEKDDDKCVFARETFVMDIPTLRLKHIDLKTEPVENSIRLVAKCKPNIVYKKHYLLKKNESGLNNRLSWDLDDVQVGTLLFKLKENDVVEVQYVKKQ